MSKTATKIESVTDQLDVYDDDHELYFEDYALVSVLVIVGVAELALRFVFTLILCVSILGLIALDDARPLNPYCFGAAERVLKGAYRKRRGRPLSEGEWRNGRRGGFKYRSRKG